MRVTLEPSDYKISRRLFRRIWRLTTPYWTRASGWRSWIAMGALLVMAPAVPIAWAYRSELLKHLTNAIVAKDAAAFDAQLTMFLAVFGGYQLLLTAMNFIDSRLDLHWRHWLTMHIVDRYLDRRTYYDIAVAEDLDNPDQRIQEDLKPFVNAVTYFPRQILSQLLSLLMGGVILASITPRVFWFVAGYAVLQTVISLWLYVPTIRHNFEITVAEADLRYGILHVHDHAETIAFYGGERAERAQILRRVSTAIAKNVALAVYTVKMGLFNHCLSVVWQAMPYLLLVPLFLEDRIEYGAIAQATMAATSMLQAMTLLVNFIPTLSAAAPRAVRLAQIVERFDVMDASEADLRVPRLVITPGSAVRLEHVTLETPGGEQTLVRELTLSVAKGEHLIITGQTGVGKSSVLRVMAGLWRRGRGRLEMPPRAECLFLPQRPYMILADLRSQLLYPGAREDVPDAVLQNVLRHVRLPSLLDRHGGLDAVRDWGKVLSLGEQQRLAFARVLITAPRFVFLDEATSAVDLETERALYTLLAQSGATYISVGHRDSLLAFHRRVLHLLPSGEWHVTAPTPTSVTASVHAASARPA
jgi:putative ATP-binding cassette transporter